MSLLGCHDGRRYESIYDEQGLSTTQCLEFLFAHGGGKCIGWKWDWDANCVLADVPEGYLRLLWEDGSVYLNSDVYGDGSCKLTYYPDTMFSFKQGERSFFLSDLGRWGGSLEEACTKWQVPIDPLITEGKANREHLEDWSLEDLRAYNCAELKATVALGERILGALEGLGFKGDSPGGAAKALLRSWGAESFMREVEELVNA